MCHELRKRGTSGAGYTCGRLPLPELLNSGGRPYSAASRRYCSAGLEMVTISSALVGWIATVASKSGLGARGLTAMPRGGGKSGLGGGGLRGRAESLPILARLWPDDMAAEDPAAFGVDDELHHH